MLCTCLVLLKHVIRHLAPWWQLWMVQMHKRMLQFKHLVLLFLQSLERRTHFATLSHYYRVWRHQNIVLNRCRLLLAESGNWDLSVCVWSITLIQKPAHILTPLFWFKWKPQLTNKRRQRLRQVIYTITDTECKWDIFSKSPLNIICIR